MAGQMRRGWSMARGSFAVLKRYPRLAILPMVSGAILLLAVGAILSSLMPHFGPLHDATRSLWDSYGDGNVLFYVTAFAVIYVLTAVMIFCNVALIHCALRAHAGEEPSVRDGLAAAAGLLPQILGWALVATTVGIVLNAIESFIRDKLGIFGSLFSGLLQLSWTVITYFVLPILVTERAGPITALRRSSALLKSKWGESLAGEVRFGLLGALGTVIAMLVFFLGLAVALTYGATGIGGLGPILMTLGVILGVAIMVMLQTLSAIFQSGVYLYATTGQVPATLDREMLEGAFKPKS